LIDQRTHDPQQPLILPDCPGHRRTDVGQEPGIPRWIRLDSSSLSSSRPCHILLEYSHDNTFSDVDKSVKPNLKKGTKLNCRGLLLIAQRGEDFRSRRLHQLDDVVPVKTL